ncbi:MAG: hypothetical protein R2681_14990 [Pyrinomonadaceae bacterium]
MELMDAVDSYIPEPTRDVDQPFLMPVEDIFTIQGNAEQWQRDVLNRGIIKVNEPVEIVGIKDTELGMHGR